MRTFFFGRGRRLYGALHEPHGGTTHTGVLLCYPGVQEYNMTHWAFRRLAGLLTRDGLPALRFDWSCTGDSEGDSYDGRIDHWVEDVATAAEELKDATGVRRVSVVGMRLGALLATQAVAKGLKVTDLVLWEPIFSGTEYVRDLERLDTDSNLRRTHRISEPRIELAGYPFPSSFRQSVLDLSLDVHVPKAASRVAMFLPKPSAAATQTQALWERAGVRVSSQVVREESGGVTEGARGGDAAVLYGSMLAAIAAQLSPEKVSVAA